jgi:6-phosphogluconolactonase
MPIYQYLATHSLIWDRNIRVVLSDERLVPVDSPFSNTGRIWPCLRQSGLTDPQWVAPEVTLPLEESATAFDRRLHDFMNTGGKLELALIGLGADGHTASLFHIEDAVKNTGCFALPVVRPTPPHRITVSADFLKRARRLIFWVGSVRGKENALRIVREAPDTIPAGRIAATVPNAEFWTCT